MTDPTPAQRPVSPSYGRGHRPTAIEYPTLLLLLGTYGGWLAVTAAYDRWPLWVVAPLAAILVALHSSLQHELVHGHPTPWDRVNRALGSVSLSLWLPFERYRETHLIHHVNERLTDPHDDPESYYWLPDDWARVGALQRAFVHVQQTLAGRVVIGSFYRIGRFLTREFVGIVRGTGRLRSVWFEHLLWCVPVILWLTLACRMPLWLYFVAVVFPANGLQLIRSFAEHRARPSVGERIAIVERSWILGPLFLFNNLHALHHAEPHIPWYRYNARYRELRDQLIRENGGLVYTTYFEVAQRYLFRPHDTLMHPTGGIPRR